MVKYECNITENDVNVKDINLFFENAFSENYHKPTYCYYNKGSKFNKYIHTNGNRSERLVFLIKQQKNFFLIFKLVDYDPNVDWERELGFQIVKNRVDDNELKKFILKQKETIENLNLIIKEKDEMIKKIVKENEENLNILNFKLNRDIEEKLNDLKRTIYFDINSKILGDNINYKKNLVSWGAYGHWKLKLRGFRGDQTNFPFSAALFHQHCNDISVLLVIVKSIKGNIFGAYSTVHFSSSNTQCQSTEGWLFSLMNPSGKPIRMSIYQNATNAIYDHSGYGPTYGGNYDLHISNNCLNDAASYSNISNTYMPPRIASNNTFLDGQQQFQVDEIEIFERILS